MKAKRAFVRSAGLFWLCSILAAAPALAGETPEPVRATLDKLLTAVEANDYEAFVAEGTAAVKAGLTKQMLEGVSSQFAPRLKAGYACAFLGELQQQGCRVLLWKLTYRDGGDDTLAKLVLQGDKVAGFWLQ